ncbi:MAG: DUF4139 domain-containing protein [Thermodesulfovibrionia bacterium]|nr:DUF4139 domain-containing protein [Thermodesulfovibrionia bacterium]
MRERIFHRHNILLITLFLVLFISVGSSTVGAIRNDSELKTISTGIDDQVGIALTVYNVNLGLVKDVRELTLDRGIGNLRFMDVASGIIPTSVSIRSLIDANSFNILEQNYEYDLLNPQKLMDKYVGKKVKLFNKNPYTEREDIVDATLLSDNGGVIYQIGDEITFNYPGRVIFPEVPDDLISKPTLVWMFENTLPSKQKVEASYLTNGINWRADYVVTLNDKDDMANLSGWVTIENMSGTTYKDAKLKLVAGDVNRVKDEREYDERMMYAAKAMVSEEQFKEDAFFEYHIYTLQRNSTIKNNQTKQISLVTADDIPVKKEFIFQGAAYYYRTQYGQPLSNQKVGVYVEIANMEKHNLGIPLPKGTIRIYKNDNEGSLQFVGEDSIDHTPKDEKIKVKLGDAFDVVGSRKQTSWEKIAYDTYEAGYEISLRNHKKEDIVVKVVEPVQGDWKMISSSHDYNKTEAFTAEFNIHVPKDKEFKLNYKVRMKF